MVNEPSELEAVRGLVREIAAGTGGNSGIDVGIMIESMLASRAGNDPGIALVMSPMCIKLLGANGAILSIIVTTLVVASLQAWAYVKNLRNEAAASEPADVAVGAAR